MQEKVFQGSFQYTLFIFFYLTHKQIHHQADGLTCTCWPSLESKIEKRNKLKSLKISTKMMPKCNNIKIYYGVTGAARLI